ncbi:MAG TPA: LytTR family DNA-binding domain-containing protein [Puia sp.]|nr:LytTR family DNA-binding domain-containing protein [Puia sp.]
MNVLIIEDEARSAKELVQLIAAADAGVRVIAILESVEQGVAWLAANPNPDLIFSDIQLTDGSSFDIFQRVPITCPIVFCTAFDDYLMDAFETNAISYLLKPVTREKVEGALQKLRLLRGGDREDGQAGVQSLLRRLKQPYKSTILVNLREKIIPVATRDIAYFYMEHSVVEVCTLQQQKYFITGSMDELEKTLDPELFFRANRQYLIGRAAIASVERSFSRKLMVKLTVPTRETVVVSKAKASEFLGWLA